MRRLIAEKPEERTAQPGPCSPIRRAIVAAPLIAGIIAGAACTESELPNDCKSYNGTTITLNQPTDGLAPDLRAIESIPRGSFLLPAHIDFINEAHALASDGLPQGTKATQSPSYCLMSGPNGGQRSAYAQQSDEDGAQRGLYVPENQSLDSILLINLVNHEIGHLQPGNPVHGSEVLSQLNEYEQKLAGFALLSMAGADTDQLVRWSYHEAHSGLFHKLRRTLESGRGRDGGEPLDAYDKANMFIFTRLGENGGDIQSIRTEFRDRVANNTLNSELDAASAAFLQGYGTENLADLFIAVRIRLIQAIQAEFGEGAAYSIAHSNILAPGLANGLDGMNCYATSPIEPADYSPCSGDACEELGADTSRPVTVSLCCISAEINANGVEFSKWDVEAGGTRYENSGGSVSSGGFPYGSMTYLSATRAAIGPDDPCI